MSFASLQASSASSYPLVPYGWDADWTAEFAPYGEQGLLPGRVVRVDRGQCDLVTADGVVRADTEFVVPRDPMKVVCTGDWAAVDPAGPDPRYVRTLLPRRTAFVRSTSSKRSEGQILAANVDHAIVAVSLAAELDLGRIERFLALAWESGAQPAVVLTKADLVPDTAMPAYLVQPLVVLEDRQDNQSGPAGRELAPAGADLLQVTADQAGNQVQGGARQRQTALVDKPLSALGGAGVLSHGISNSRRGHARYAGIRPRPVRRTAAAGR